jgi:hypothetical protein
MAGPSEIPPNPPFKKGGQGGFLARAVVPGKILVTGCRPADHEKPLKSDSSDIFRTKSIF